MGWSPIFDWEAKPLVGLSVVPRESERLSSRGWRIFGTKCVFCR